MLCNRVVVAVVVVVVAIAARPTYYHRGSLEGSFTHFCHFKFISETFHLKVKHFFTSSNGLAYY